MLSPPSPLHHRLQALLASPGWSAHALADVLYAHTPEALHAALQPWGGLGATDAYGWTPMMVAITVPDASDPQAVVRLVDAMLALGVSARDLARDGTTPLLAACAQGQDEVVARLLATGIPPFNPRHQQAHPRGTTPLHEAAGVSAAVVGRLLAAGADATVGNRDGDRPLHLAVWSGRADTVQALLAAGVSPNVPTLSGDHALHGAATVDPAITRLLLEHGAEVDAVNRQGATALHTLVQALPGAGNTYRSRVRRADALLAAGANPNRLDAYGQTPLHALLTQDVIEWPLLTALVRRGANLTLIGPGQQRSAGDWLHHRCTVDAFSRNVGDGRRFERLLELYEVVQTAHQAMPPGPTGDSPTPSPRARRRL